MSRWICSVSRALRSSRSGCGRLRSAKTLPLPASKPIFFLRFVMSVLPFLVKPLGFRQPAAHQINFLLRSRSARLRLLLKGVKHVEHIRELRGVDGAVGVRVVPVDDLHDARAAEPSQRLGRRIRRATLRGIKGLANVAANLRREATQIAPARSDPHDRPNAVAHYTNIRILVSMSRKAQSRTPSSRTAPVIATPSVARRKRSRAPGLLRRLRRLAMTDIPHPALSPEGGGEGSFFEARAAGYRRVWRGSRPPPIPSPSRGEG